MQLDPFVRRNIISARESAKRGDVYKAGSVMGTPGPHRSAESIKKFWGKGTYQLTDPVKKRKGPGKAEGGRIGFKRGKAVTKADLAKRDLWRKRILRKRSKIGQRKSKWDVQGAISGHPLNPFRIHAEGKALDWSSKRKDVYVRTRDDLKKSRDPEVKKVAENFQQMDYKDKAKSDPRYIEGSKFYKKQQPKLTKRTHVGRKTGGRIGFGHGSSTSKIARYESKVEPIEITPLIGPKGGGGKLPVKKHTAYRKEIAGLKKIHHTKTKLLKKQEARKELASKEALAPKYSPYGKQLASQAPINH